MRILEKLKKCETVQYSMLKIGIRDDREILQLISSMTIDLYESDAKVLVVSSPLDHSQNAINVNTLCLLALCLQWSLKKLPIWSPLLMEPGGFDYVYSISSLWRIAPLARWPSYPMVKIVLSRFPLLNTSSLKHGIVPASPFYSFSFSFLLV